MYFESDIVLFALMFVLLVFFLVNGIRKRINQSNRIKQDVVPH